MKRFTETEKWNDQWFRELPCRLKCLWVYLCDNCDPSGVIRLDWDLASFRIGEKVTPEDLKAFGHRLQELPNGKQLIRKFIPFQYGRLRIECRGHRSVIQAIASNGIVEEFSDESQRVCIGYAYIKHTPAVPVPNSVRQDRTGSVHKDGQNGKTTPEASPEYKVLCDQLREMYARKLCEPFDYFEEFAIHEIVTTRPEHLAELAEIRRYRSKVEAKYFPRSVKGLLESWSKTLDYARSFTANPELAKPRKAYTGPNL